MTEPLFAFALIGACIAIAYGTTAFPNKLRRLLATVAAKPASEAQVIALDGAGRQGKDLDPGMRGDRTRWTGLQSVSRTTLGIGVKSGSPGSRHRSVRTIGHA